MSSIRLNPEQDEFWERTIAEVAKETIDNGGDYTDEEIRLTDEAVITKWPELANYDTWDPN